MSGTAVAADLPGGSASPPPPAGPAAALTPLTGGNGPYLAETAPDLAKVGYVQNEYTAAGTAASYQPVGAVGGDGRWTFTPDGSAPYRTRVLVRQPKKTSAVKPVVVVEWLNVSGGSDTNPDWASTQEEITRQGEIWVGVSAQRIGIEGGPALFGAPGRGLKEIDPARYGALSHPGDGFSFDIFTQVAKAIRSGAGLAGQRPGHLIAVGDSQSASALVTYYNGVQPLSHAFDGFLVHSRGTSALPPPGPGENADPTKTFGAGPVLFRTDQAAPVLGAQTETDVALAGTFAARQPDNPHYRLWEVAGTAHADAHLLGSAASSFNCGTPVNNGAMHIVVKAALRALTSWVTTGHPPAPAPRLELTQSTPPQLARNSDGIALGGIRTPPVDVPVATLSGIPGSTSLTCVFFGSTKQFTPERLAALYPSRSDYQARYAADTAATIIAGYALPQDKAALLAYAQPDLIHS